MVLDNKELVAWMKGHGSAIHSISLHASGRYALTTSSDTALLWDLDTFTRKRKLNVKEDVGISKVGFVFLIFHSVLEFKVKTALLILLDKSHVVNTDLYAHMLYLCILVLLKMN